MKTTNFELSKKLAEIGFKAERSYDYLWEHNGIGATRFKPNTMIEDDYIYQHISNGFYPAYDLETLLDALPKKQWDIKNCGEMLSILPAAGRARIVVVKKENESLADTAARLLLLLVEKNIINFKF